MVVLHVLQSLFRAFLRPCSAFFKRSTGQLIQSFGLLMRAWDEGRGVTRRDRWGHMHSAREGRGNSIAIKYAESAYMYLQSDWYTQEALSSAITRPPYNLHDQRTFNVRSLVLPSSRAIIGSRQHIEPETSSHILPLRIRKHLTRLIRAAGRARHQPRRLVPPEPKAAALPLGRRR